MYILKKILNIIYNFNQAKCFHVYHLYLIPQVMVDYFLSELSFEHLLLFYVHILK